MTISEETHRTIIEAARSGPPMPPLKDWQLPILRPLFAPTPRRRRKTAA